MSGFRAYFENLKDAKLGGALFLSPDESRHLCGALRAQKSDKVDVFDLSGAVLECEISVPSPKKAELKILSRRDLKDGRPRIILAQCMPKGKTFDDIIKSAIQLGATAIIPVVSERTIVRFSDGKDRLSKLEKWRAQIVEAVKQSANMLALKVFEPVDFGDFIKRADFFVPRECARIVASLDAENPKPVLSILDEKNPSGVCVLIGPEGDLSKEEYKAAYLAGFAPATLGDSVMKSDVAAGFSISVCSAFFQKKSQ